MRRSRLAIGLVGTALLVIVALCVLTALNTYGWMQSLGDVRFGGILNTSAQVTETRSVTPAGQTRLRLSNEFGDIALLPADGETLVIEMVKTGWGADEAEAQAVAEGLTVQILETAGEISISHEGVRQELGFFTSQGGVNRVDFTVRVPAGLDVVVEGHNGELLVSGLETAADLTMLFGGMTVRDHTGALVIESSNGQVTLENIDAGASDIAVDLRFGNAEVKDVRGANLQFTNANGNLVFDRLTLRGELRIENGFGQTTLRESTAASLLLTSRNGNVEVRDTRISGRSEVSNDFGNTVLVGLSASETVVNTRNGEVTVEGASGALTASVDFGGLTITGAQDVALNITAENSTIRFSGSLAAGANHRITNRFGEITLNLPASSAFDLDFSTAFGNISTDFAVTVQGEIDPQELQGSINGGGNTLTVSNENGNIHLNTLTP
ncbi:MAG: hypothetical protein EPO32_07365 [Anaerolineae bacterium]|nr:MAG: hypothetical protein EPO32_07365 [Anaerolineae bacterium]